MFHFAISQETDIGLHERLRVTSSVNVFAEIQRRAGALIMGGGRKGDRRAPQSEAWPLTGSQIKFLVNVTGHLG